jgi:4-amino-4-deoxy-L-arabinose transferase-like glycosyltransferase
MRIAGQRRVSTSAGERSEPSPLAGVLAISALAAALFIVRLTGLPNLVDNEFRLGACVLNAIQGGNWIAPHNALGTLDKPPMLTWLAALAALVFGRVDLLTLYLPTALATAILAVLVYTWGTRHAGGYAGLFAGIAYLASNVTAQQIATARWDGLFALTVALVALAGFRAWNIGGGWTLFWLAAAVSTLTKGPLGLLLGGLGLLAVVWERRSGRPQELRGSHVLGVALFLAIVFGWFGLAYLRWGPRIFDNLIRSELVRHAVMNVPGHRFGKPPSDFLANFAPWSVLTILGMWHILAHPAPDDGRRRFERFCFCWFLGGLLVFAISPHNPARLLYPIIPPAALIAGCEADRLTRGLRPAARLGGCAAVIVIALTLFTLKYHRWDHRREHVRHTLAILRMHDAIASRVGESFPLTYARDVPFALQLTFNTMRPAVTTRNAAALLRSENPAYVLVGDATRLRRRMGHGAPPLYEIASAPIGSTPYLTLLSNRPELDDSDRVAIGLGPLRVVLSQARLGTTQDGTIVVTPETPTAQVVVTNGGATPTTVDVRVRDQGAGRHDLTWRLAPHESATWSAPDG